MIDVRLAMRYTDQPLKRVPVVLRFDADQSETDPVLTDRSGHALFELPARSGKVLVNGIERYHGLLDGEINIELWSLTDPEDMSVGAPGGIDGGSTQYPDMQTREVLVNGQPVLTDSEGYLVSPSDWSEAFVRAQAESEGLVLTNEHWEIIRFLRQRFAEAGAQASVRDMVKHFKKVWGPEKGSNRYLHQIFPRGGPQKQGNRLAGLLRTKGEH
jgi:tRNA 2-thiouridine synthesizing protein E